jgi:hypothetical protein
MQITKFETLLVLRVIGCGPLGFDLRAQETFQTSKVHLT